MRVRGGFSTPRSRLRRHRPDVLVLLLAGVRQPHDRDAVLGEQPLGQLERLGVDLVAHLLHGGERRRPHVRLAQSVVVRVLVVRAREMVDVRLRDVGAERLLGRIETGTNGAVVRALDELGVRQPLLAEAACDLLARGRPTPPESALSRSSL